MSKINEPVIKILIIGPSNVGKSALLKRYCDDDFDPNDATATIGIDFRVKRLSVRGKIFRVTLFDTAGQERFRTLSNSYYRGAHGIVFVYDLTNRATFARMDDWFAEAEANTTGVGTDTSPPCQYCLVAAKADRADTNRAVSADEGRALARKYAPGHGTGNPSDDSDNSDDSCYAGTTENTPDATHDAHKAAPLFFETSSCTGQNVREPFVALVDRIVSSGAVSDSGRRSYWGPSSVAPASGTVSLGASTGEESYLSECSC